MFNSSLTNTKLESTKNSFYVNMQFSLKNEKKIYMKILQLILRFCVCLSKKNLIFLIYIKIKCAHVFYRCFRSGRRSTRSHFLLYLCNISFFVLCKRFEKLLVFLNGQRPLCSEKIRKYKLIPSEYLIFYNTIHN